MCVGKSLRNLGLRRETEKWGWAVENLVELKTIFEMACRKGRPAGFGKARSGRSNP